MSFRSQGLKQRHRRKARQIEPGDYFFYYITGIQKLAAMVIVKSFVTEAGNKIWVNLGKDPDECYPWRFELEPRVILDKTAWIPMEHFSKKLLHFRKWPEKNWRLGLQGQIHALRAEDSLLLKRALIQADSL